MCGGRSLVCSSVVDCGRVAGVRVTTDKRLRLQVEGSQAIAVLARRLDAPQHFEVQGCIHSEASTTRTRCSICR